TQVEDTLASGTLKVEEPFKNRQPPFNRKPNVEVNAIAQPMQVTHSNSPVQAREQACQFTNLYMPLERVFEKLKARNLLFPLEPRPLPNPLPRYFKEHEYCQFHQTKGHHTNQCMRLRHEIQDLIDKKIIAPPNPSSQPNVTNNPLPTHAVPPPAQINALGLDDPKIRHPIRPYIPLQGTLTQAFYQARSQGLITPLVPRFRQPFCQYHNLFGHDTEHCRVLGKLGSS
ncbi:hypothetical protein HGI15_22285, partial [Modestobacter lapidis]|nr:hypothetical protein [Modestobacter lapidis]